MLCFFFKFESNIKIIWDLLPLFGASWHQKNDAAVLASQQHSFRLKPFKKSHFIGLKLPPLKNITLPINDSNPMFSVCLLFTLFFNLLKSIFVIKVLFKFIYFASSRATLSQRHGNATALKNMQRLSSDVF
jgi:hypothetical protein